MKRTFKTLLAAAALAFVGLGSLLTATPAQAAIVCDEQGPNSSTYPLDGAGAATSHAYRCKNTANGAKPSDARTQDLFNSLASMPANVRNQLKSKNVNYYYFNNRSEAITYFNSTAPFNDQVNYESITPFAQSTSRCGATGYATNRFTGVPLIAVAIYDNCNYDQNTNPSLYVQNPSVRKTGFHESGHAFDFSFGLGGGDFPSNRSGFVSLFNGDKTLLTPSNWAQYSTGSKNNYICNLFSYASPSAFEKELGATSNGGPGGQVCQTNLVPYTYYQTKTPTQIASEKLPYFMGNKQEIWAEAFVIVVEGNNTSPASFLPITDRVIGMNQSPVRSFNCVRATLESYINLLTSPKNLPASDPYSLPTKGCPVPSGAL
jgi:hypothetical protein